MGLAVFQQNFRTKSVGAGQVWPTGLPNPVLYNHIVPMVKLLTFITIVLNLRQYSYGLEMYTTEILRGKGNIVCNLLSNCSENISEFYRSV